MDRNKEIDALLSLMDDPDREVFSTVSERIMDIGKDMITSLEDHWRSSTEEIVMDRIEMLIHKLHFRELQEEFVAWANHPHPDLLEGAFLVSRYKFPDLRQDIYKGELERLCKSIWIELNNYLTPLEQINIVNKVFYSHHMFKGVEISYRNQEDFLIPKLLDNRKGNSLANGILYQTVCQMLDIPVRAIHIPRQFILAYFANPLNIFQREPEPQRILFFIDPISGQVYSQKDVEHYFSRISVSMQSDHFHPMNNRNIIAFLIEEFAKCFNDEKTKYKQHELLGLGEMLLERNGKP